MPAFLLAAASVTQASTIWDGPTNGFFGVNTPDPLLPNVYFNRLNGVNTGGLFNSGTNNGSSTAIETAPGTGSPKGTGWSQSGNTLASYAGISYGNCPFEEHGSPSGDIGHPYVVHLFTNDVYFQLTLTNWGGAGGGGTKTFGYVRSTPTVPPAITSPSANASFSAPASVTFQATVMTNVPVQFTNVEFFTNNVLMTSVISKPFNFTANNLGAGSYALTAVEIAAGNFTTSSIVNFTVSSPSSTPSVTITNPASGAVFSAPANLTVGAMASDTGGTIASVQFSLTAGGNTAVIGNVTTSPYVAVTNNVGAGSYTLKAIATDNNSITSTSSIPISVVTPTPISLGSSAATGSTNFGFSYAANVGLDYVVQVSTNLALGNWVSLVTNVAASNPVVFVDLKATNNASYYRVGLLPNP
ncbi:MAG TPA: Ig-like domain-containing protein [Verrucomicrobiae bacterium]